MTRRGILFVLILLLLGGGAVLTSIRVLATDRVVYLDPEATGPDPFTPPAVYTSDSPPPPTPIDPTVSITTPPDLVTPGDNPGPVGANAKKGECDPELLIQHLNSTPERLVSWLELQGVLGEEFEDYVRGARPALLSRDTRVTLYGFRDGGSAEMQAILAQGTAVLVNGNDEIAVRCFSGSPIKPPRQIDRYRCDACPPDLATPVACNETCYEVPSETTSTTTSTAPGATSTTVTAPAQGTTTTTAPRSGGTRARRSAGRTPTTRRAATAPPTSPPGAIPTIDPNFFSTQPRTFPSAAPAPPTTMPPTDPTTQPPTAPTIPPTTFPQQTTTQPPSGTNQPQAATQPLLESGGSNCDLPVLGCIF